MQEEINYQRRRKVAKWLLISLGFLIIVMFGYLIINIGNYSSIEVLSKYSNATVTIFREYSNNQTTDQNLINTKANIVTKINPGLYAIKLSYLNSSTTVSINLLPKQHKIISPILVSSEYTSLLGSYSPINLFIDPKNNIYFINSFDGSYDLLSNQDVLSSIATSQTFTRAVWSNQGSGVGLTLNNNLYLLNQNSVSKLSLSFKPNYFTITNNGTIYLTSSNLLYSYLNNNLSLVKKLSFIPTGLYANDGLLLINYDLGRGHPINNYNKPFIESIYKGQTYKYYETSYSNSISNNGLIASTSDNATVILNPYLQIMKTLPFNNVDSLAWLNNTNLLFSIGSKLYKYNLSNNTTTKLAITQNNQPIDNIYAFNNSIILTVPTKNSNNALKMYLIYNNPNNFSVNSSSFPELTNGCLLGYSDIHKPTVQIYAPPTGLNCVPIAQNYISNTLDLNLNSFGYSTSNVAPSEASIIGQQY